MAAVNEDPTKELPGASPFEQRVLAEFATLHVAFATLHAEVAELRSQVSELRNQQVAMAKHVVALVQRMNSLEGKVDKRLKETRPIWEGVRAQIEKLDEKFNIFIRDLYDVRGDIGVHNKRLDVLERRLLS
jgi:predicted  nucleic acid-binding Zn-ribbon protein